MTGGPISYERVEMYDGLDYLLAPVMAGMCLYTDLKNGNLDLADVAKMNDALAVRAENEARAHKAAMERNG